MINNLKDWKIHLKKPTIDWKRKNNINQSNLISIKVHLDE